jgi:hypothetical protein
MIKKQVALQAVRFSNDRKSASGKRDNGNVTRLERQSLRLIRLTLYSKSSIRNCARQAHRYLRKERGGHTLQTTALVHEAYLKLIQQKTVRGKAVRTFSPFAAVMMRGF